MLLTLLVKDGGEFLSAHSTSHSIHPSSALAISADSEHLIQDSKHLIILDVGRCVDGVNSSFGVLIRLFRIVILSAANLFEYRGDSARHDALQGN